ncbi:MAG: hypothetical protein LM582_02255 [Desulfurococcaceae archaeon]|nr:hypothetical protein [Desulfurococcaceae archaeon]
MYRSSYGMGSGIVLYSCLSPVLLKKYFINIVVEVDKLGKHFEIPCGETDS